MVTSTPASTPMLSRTHSVAQSAKSPQIQSKAEVRAAKAEAALEEVKKDFEIYREEKSTHEKMLSESLESTRAELGESRAKSMKLGTIDILRQVKHQLASDEGVKSGNESYCRLFEGK